jgi:hypothetical protein
VKFSARAVGTFTDGQQRIGTVVPVRYLSTYLSAMHVSEREAARPPLRTARGTASIQHSEVGWPGGAAATRTALVYRQSFLTRYQRQGPPREDDECIALAGRIILGDSPEHRC